MSYKILHSKLFSPPDFLDMPFVSLDIQPAGITFLTVKNRDQGILPNLSGFIPLPLGSIENGELIKKEQIIESLITIRKRTGVSFSRCSIPEEQTYLFKTTLPDLKTSEIHDFLEFKIEENVPLSVKEVVFDYDILSTHSKKNEREAVVAVSAIKTIEDLQNILDISGLPAVFFSPESNNIAKSIIKSSNEQVIVVVNIRANTTILSLVVHNVVCQTSSINFGGSTFVTLLRDYFKMPESEIEKIKKDKLYLDNPNSMEIFSHLINTISALKDELFKFISYCNERKDIVNQVDKIILCGQDALIVGLDKYLSLNLNIEVQIANVWTNNFDLDSYIPKINKIDSMSLATVNGLSLL